MKKLKIALLQISPCGSLEENLNKGIEFCKKAKQSGADIALFPEMWSNGYNIYDRPADEWLAEAIDADSDFVTTFGKLAKELDMAITITFLEKHSGSARTVSYTHLDYSVCLRQVCTLHKGCGGIFY